MSTLPKGPFATIVADPPWPYSSARAIIRTPLVNGTGVARGVAAADNYPLMSMVDLKALDVRPISAKDAHLYLWTTNSFIVEAHDLARAWGFEPKTVLTWAKVKKGSDEFSMKTGTYYRSATEHVLFAVRGRLRLLGPCVPTVFYHERLPHSVKPDSFYATVEEQSPGPYLEMFARRPRSGWTVWGNEVPVAPQA